jgi:hypothetical protein
MEQLVWPRESFDARTIPQVFPFPDSGNACSLTGIFTRFLLECNFSFLKEIGEDSYGSTGSGRKRGPNLPVTAQSHGIRFFEGVAVMTRRLACVMSRLLFVTRSRLIAMGLGRIGHCSSPKF